MITINKGVGDRGNSGFTNDPNGIVELQIFAPGATQMMLSSKPSFSGAEWETFRDTKRWQLEGEDGYKSVFAKFRFKDNTETKHTEAHIQLDRKPPTNGRLIIEGGSTHTSSERRVVKMDIDAEDALWMQVSNTKDFKGATWESFKKGAKTWVLSNNDGKQSVYVRFKDLAGNISEPSEANIILDRTPPTQAKIVVNGGAEFTTSNKVKLKIYAQGATQMFISILDKWLPYQEDYELELPTNTEGPTHIEVSFADEAGNRTLKVYDDIIVDTTPPEDTKIVVSGGDKYIKQNTVPLNMSAMSANEMMISNDATFKGSQWVPYNIVYQGWKLTPGNGEKQVFAKFRDRAGNESQPVVAEITVDNEAPKNLSVKIVGKIRQSTNNKEGIVDLEITAEGADYMMLSNSPDFYKARWDPFKTLREAWLLGTANEDGDKTVYIKFRDKAGNVSESIMTKIRLDRTGPLDCKISVKGEYVTSLDIEITTFARGAERMMISNDMSFSNSEWMPYSSIAKWKLEDRDGKNIPIYAKFDDAAGNPSRVVATSVNLDRTPPQNCEIKINGGDEKTNNIDKKVFLKVKAEEAKFMMISNQINFNGARWDGYTEEIISNWILQGEDGEKFVYVKFKDIAGNESQIFNAKIFLDRKPPMGGAVKILSENELSRIQKVDLELSAEQADEMMISNFYDFRDGKWEAYMNRKSQWPLIDADGLKTVFVKYRKKVTENNYNYSIIAYDKIGLDRRAPANGSLVINDKAKYCTDIKRQVTLRLYAREATEMMISNEPDFANSEWRKYELFVNNWDLGGEDTTKYVYAKFRDKAQNETKAIMSSIIMDRQEPTEADVDIDNNLTCTNNAGNKVLLKIKAKGATKMMISNREKFSPELRWETYEEVREWRLEGMSGTKVVYVKFKDDADNESSVAKDDILLDTQAPISGTVKINDGKTITNESTVLLKLNARDADYMWISNDSKDLEEQNPEQQNWEPYQPIKEWHLTEGAGRRSVYIKYKDSCENKVLRPISASITVAYDE
ncbi:MAG: hypothetical protein EAZ97_15610 [Bacteroidetes bacterium]|nr:MAG: hypothetical protein EAZ97_15610 [Bacteroidota bacterium]